MGGEDLEAVGKVQKSRGEVGTQRQRISPLILDWDGPSNSAAVPLTQPGECKRIIEREIVLTRHDGLTAPVSTITSVKSLSSRKGRKRRKITLGLRNIFFKACSQMAPPPDKQITYR